MAETKYGRYIIREPLDIGRAGTNLHVCGEAGCVGAQFAGFPAEMTMIGVGAPMTMNPEPHAHDYDQFLCFLGGNPLNLFDFGAEVEIVLGEEKESHFIDTTSVVFVPKGLMHCPIIFKKVTRPVVLMHICFAPEYTRSAGDMSSHPAHRSRIKYSPVEQLKLRGRQTASR
jgi:hypothetical protein